MLHFKRRALGLTLLELMFALAVSGIAVTVGVPALRGLVLDARRAATTNGLVASVQLARSAAVRRSLPVVLCPGDRDAGCQPRSGWPSGWFVFVNVDGDEPPQLDDGETVLHTEVPPDGIVVAANRDAFVFNRIGIRATNGTLTVCDPRGGARARAVIVSYTGRPRVAGTRADGSPIDC